MTTRIWLTTAQAAEHSGHHADTIRKALEADELHGSQRTVKGRWRVHHLCLDAWVAGSLCEHQKAGAA